MEEQNRQILVLRNALHSYIGDRELQVHVDTVIRHYFDLFNMKAIAARADVFYVMFGLWKTPVERYFFWIGGSRPSELLKVIVERTKKLIDIYMYIDTHDLELRSPLYILFIISKAKFTVVL